MDPLSGEMTQTGIVMSEPHIYTNTVIQEATQEAHINTDMLRACGAK